MPLPDNRLAGEVCRSRLQEQTIEPSTTVTPDLIRHRQAATRSRFANDCNLLSGLDVLSNGLTETLATSSFGPLISGTSYIRRAQYESFLQSFLEWYLCKSAGAIIYPGASTTDFLARPFPRISLAGDTSFWRSLAFVLSKRHGYCRNILANEPERHHRSVRTSINAFVQVKGAYSRFSGHCIDAEVLAGCHGVLETYSAKIARDKPIATWDNVLSIIKDGVYSIDLRCARERTQVNCFLLLLAFTAARPSEITLGNLHTDGLKWKDVVFYVSLNAKKQLRLGCDVRFRNLKGMRRDDSAL